MKPRIIIPALLVCCGLALSGCEGVHLYDAEKDKIATAIKTKKSEIDIEQVIKTERENLQLLLDHEIGIRDRFIEQVRSRVIWKFVYKRKTLDSVLRPVYKRRTPNSVLRPINYAARRLRQLGVKGKVNLVIRSLRRPNTMHI